MQVFEKNNRILLSILALLISNTLCAQNKYYFLKSSCASCGPESSGLHSFYTNIVKTDSPSELFTEFHNEMIDQFPAYIGARSGSLFSQTGYKTYYEAFNARRAFIAKDLTNDYNVHYINGIGYLEYNGGHYFSEDAKYFVYQYSTCAVCGPDREQYLFISKGITLLDCASEMSYMSFDFDYGLGAFFDQIKIDYPNFYKLPRNGNDSNCYGSLEEAKKKRNELIEEYRSKGYKIKMVKMGYNSTSDFPFTSSSKKRSYGNTGTKSEQKSESEAERNARLYLFYSSKAIAAESKYDYMDANYWWDQALPYGNFHEIQERIKLNNVHIVSAPFFEAIDFLSQHPMVSHGFYRGHFGLVIGGGSTSYNDQIWEVGFEDYDGITFGESTRWNLNASVQLVWSPKINTWLSGYIASEFNPMIIFNSSQSSEDDDNSSNSNLYPTVGNGQTFDLEYEDNYTFDAMSLTVEAGATLFNFMTISLVQSYDRFSYNYDGFHDYVEDNRVYRERFKRTWGSKELIQTNGYGLSFGKLKDRKEMFRVGAAYSWNNGDNGWDFDPNSANTRVLRAYLDMHAGLFLYRAFFHQIEINPDVSGDEKTFERFQQFGVTIGFRIPFGINKNP